MDKLHILLWREIARDVDPPEWHSAGCPRMPQSRASDSYNAACSRLSIVANIGDNILFGAIAREIGAREAGNFTNSPAGAGFSVSDVPARRLEPGTLPWEIAFIYQRLNINRLDKSRRVADPSA
jgi:hypothetical protein